MRIWPIQRLGALVDGQISALTLPDKSSSLIRRVWKAWLAGQGSIHGARYRGCARATKQCAGVIAKHPA